MTTRPHMDVSSGSATSLFVPPTCFEKRTGRRRWLLTALFLAVLLSANALSDWNTPPVLAAAVAKPHPIPAHLTYAQYLKNGRPDHTAHGSPVLPYKPVTVPGMTTHGPTNKKRAPGAEPAAMQSITLTLSQTFLAGGANVQPIDAVGSDHRLELRVQPGSLDLSHAVVVKGQPVRGPVTLQLTQRFGHYAEGINLLGEYSLTAVDRHGHAITSIRLRAPITIVYHYQTWEMTNLGLDPGHLFLLWPDLLYATRQTHGSIAGLMIPMQDNVQAHTLTAQSPVFGGGRFDVGGGDPSNQSPAPSPLASSSGNAGQMSYSYPLQLAPGPGGFGPTLALSYSSNDPNEQYSHTSPTSPVGQGWSLGLGAITMETYPAGSAESGTQYFISGVDNISDRLVQSGTGSTGIYFDTEHLSHLHIELLNANECLHTSQPCFKVYDPSGTIYQFGDTNDSLQYYTDSTGTRHNYEWDLRLVMAPHAGAATQYDQYMASYEQDMNTDGNGHTSVRASALKQITYGLWNTQTNSQDIAGTVDFAYRAPFNDGRWATAYGTNYNCNGSPPTNTTLRCDDPLTMVHDGVTVTAPTVMQTFSLQLVTTLCGQRQHRAA